MGKTRVFRAKPPEISPKIPKYAQNMGISVFLSAPEHCRGSQNTPKPRKNPYKVIYWSILADFDVFFLENPYFDLSKDPLKSYFSAIFGQILTFFHPRNTTGDPPGTPSDPPEPPRNPYIGILGTYGKICRFFVFSPPQILVQNNGRPSYFYVSNLFSPDKKFTLIFF